MTSISSKTQPEEGTMKNFLSTIKHFSLCIWHDLIMNRNGLGFRRNVVLISDDIHFWREEARRNKL